MTLETEIKNVRNVARYSIGEGSIQDLPKLIEELKETDFSFNYHYRDSGKW